jgi:hypothetical protein
MCGGKRCSGAVGACLDFTHSSDHLHDLSRFRRPGQAKVRPLLGFIVRNPVVGLQKQGDRQQRRRHTGAAIVLTIERGEVLIPEQPSPLPG